MSRLQKKPSLASSCRTVLKDNRVSKNRPCQSQNTKNQVYQKKVSCRHVFSLTINTAINQNIKDNITPHNIRGNFPLSSPGTTNGITIAPNDNCSKAIKTSDNLSSSAGVKNSFINFYRRCEKKICQQKENLLSQKGNVGQKKHNHHQGKSNKSSGIEIKKILINHFFKVLVFVSHFWTAFLNSKALIKETILPTFAVNIQRLNRLGGLKVGTITPNQPVASFTKRSDSTEYHRGSIFTIFSIVSYCLSSVKKTLSSLLASLSSLSYPSYLGYLSYLFIFISR